MSWSRFIVGFDLHGDMQHTPTSQLFLKFCKTWKPHIRVFGGDLWDFRPLRRGACEDEKHESMKNDFTDGMQWLKEYQPNYFIRGNHDERLWERAENGKGIEADYAAKGISDILAVTDKMNCLMLPYHKRHGVLRLGHLKIIHGFNHGIYAARTTAQVYGSVLMGHTHVIEEHAIPGLERRAARVCGCLCQLDMPYNSRQPNTLRQAHGFAYGILNEKTGDYFVWQAEEINGTWFMPGDITQWKTG